MNNFSSENAVLMLAGEHENWLSKYPPRVPLSSNALQLAEITAGAQFLVKISTQPLSASVPD